MPAISYFRILIITFNSRNVLSFFSIQLILLYNVLLLILITFILTHGIFFINFLWLFLCCLLLLNQLGLLYLSLINFYIPYFNGTLLSIFSSFPFNKKNLSSTLLFNYASLLNISCTRVDIYFNSYYPNFLVYIFTASWWFYKFYSFNYF